MAGPRGYSLPPHIIFWGRGKGFLLGDVMWRREWSGISSHDQSCESHISFPVHSVISIIAVTVHSLISLFFSRNCSYLNLWSLPVLLPIFLSSMLQGREEDQTKWHVVWSVQGWALDWGISFLNHGNQPSTPGLLWYKFMLQQHCTGTGLLFNIF